MIANLLTVARLTAEIFVIDVKLAALNVQEFLTT
jgi:hypothetical protein